MDWRKLIKGAATSKTLYGLAGLLGVNIAAAPALDIRLWVNGQIFDLGNLSPYVSAALAALAVWGRLTASGPLLTDKSATAQETPDTQETPHA